MNLENWQEAKEIFNQALKLSADKRAEYLEQISLENPELGEKVKTLLESYESGFLEETAIPKIAEIISQSSFKVGQQIGHYEIKETLGVGGMGEVFLAEDFELKRLVAVKVLHPEVAADKERVRRFIQEARAASALNHPNILTIHEIGKFEDSHFIVSEYVKGKTLREKLKQKNFELTEILEIVSQVATALQAAHQAGIVHRDIKPENIMLREDGFVKVLDFGLAKLVGFGNADLGIRNNEAKTLKLKLSSNPKSEITNPKLTSPGMIMGTVSYMSPEQARGKAVDKRTDIWSLGVVLYEMLSGKLPFAGDTTSDIIASILKTEVEPLKSGNKEIPKELEAICLKALAKDKNKRYQTAHDFLQDLKGEKKRMESIMEQTAIKPFNLISEQDTELIRVPPTLSAEYIISSVKKHKFLSTVLAGVLLLIIGVGVASPWFASIQNRMGNVFTIGNDSVDSSKLEITRLTTTGRERWATISPDGKYIAHVTISPDEKRSLMVRQTSTSNSREIVPPANVQYRTPVFSPDGEYIYYVIYAGQKPALYRIPTLGGEPLLISENIRGRIGLSPDGEQVAHYSRNNPTRTPQLQVSSIKNLLDQKDEPQTIATLLPGNFSNPAWSPDGERIACIISDAETRIPKIVIYSVTGKEPQIIEVNFTQTGDSIVWLNNNELLITASNKDRYDPMQIWQVNLSGEVKRITNEWNNYYHLSITSDKATVIATQLQTNSNIFVASNENKNQLGFETQSFKQITNEVDVRFGHLGMAWTPDKRLIYHYVGIDKAQLRSVNSDGSNPRQLTPETVKMPEAPEVSSDGKSLIFSAPKDNSEIYLWRMNLSDGKISQLIFSSKNPWDTGFSLMPDGKTLIYSYISSDGKKGGLRRISVDGGEPTEILNPTDIFPVPEISPDSKHLAVMAQDFRLGLLTFPLADSNATPKFLNTNGIPPLGGEGRYFKWTPDSKSLIYIFKDKGVANLRVLPIDGSEAYNLTNFTDVQEIYSFALSTDGKRLAVARGMGNSDIVLVKNFN